MSKKTLFIAPVILLFVCSVLFAGQTMLYPVKKDVADPASRPTEVTGPEASLLPGRIPEEAFKPEGPPMILGTGQDFWQYIDPENTWMGNWYYRCVAAALEFQNNLYGGVRVVGIEYNLYYYQYDWAPLLGHIWQDVSPADGEPDWEGANCLGVAHRTWNLWGFPTYTDFLETGTFAPTRWFGAGEKFFVGWQVWDWYWGNYWGWNWDPSWNGKSWWFNTTSWYRISEQPGAPYDGCFTGGVLVDFLRYDYDAGCVSIDAPGPLVKISETVAPVATVKNSGQLDIDFDVTMTIEPGGYSSTRHTSTLGMDDTETLTFDDWTATPTCGTEYTVRVCTQLSNDENNANNCCSSTSKAYSVVFDFEENDGMFVPDPATGGWEWGVPLVPAGAHSGTKAWATDLDANYSNVACWMLTSWKFDVEEGDQVAIMYWHQMNVEGFWDGYNVKMSKDEGASWTIITPVGGYPQSGIYGNSDCYSYEPGFDGSRPWSLVKFDISPLVDPGDVVMFRYDFVSDYSVQYPGVVIDDVTLACLKPRLPRVDFDMEDDGGNLDGNRMTLSGPPGSVVAGEFNMVNPERDGENCPNVDVYDGPSESNEVITPHFPPTLISLGGGHSFNPGYDYSDAESGESQPTTLDLCQARRILLQVRIPAPTTPNKIYEGVVTISAQGEEFYGQPGLLDDDNFTLRVEVYPRGQGSVTGFSGIPSEDGNLLEWGGLNFGQNGYNLYRSENGSFTRMNESLLNGNSYLDSDVSEGVSYEYKLGLSFNDGKEFVIGPILVGRETKPTSFALYQNLPNPIRDEALIQYAVASDANVSLRVYNIAGQEVKTLVNEEKTPGIYTVSWNAEDVSNGVYFYRFTAGDFSQTRKLVVLR